MYTYFTARKYKKSPSFALTWKWQWTAPKPLFPEISVLPPVRQSWEWKHRVKVKSRSSAWK
jgi:hypothetical protein